MTKIGYLYGGALVDLVNGVRMRMWLHFQLQMIYKSLDMMFSQLSLSMIRLHTLFLTEPLE